MTSDVDRSGIWGQSVSLISATSEHFENPDREQQRRVQIALQAYAETRQGTQKQSGSMTVGRRVLIEYGRHIKQHGKNQQTYKAADRAVAILLVRRMHDSKPSSLNREKIANLIRRHSPAIPHLQSSERQQYVQELVNRVWRSPDVAKLRFQAEDAAALMPSVKDRGAPPTITQEQIQQNTRDVLAIRSDKGGQMPTAPPPKPPSLDNPERCYRDASKQVVKEQKQLRGKLTIQDVDAKITERLMTQGYQRNQIESVLRHNPHLKAVPHQKQEDYIDQTITNVERKMQELRRKEEEQQHFQAWMAQRSKSLNQN